MAAPLDPAKLDHAVELYLARKPVKEIHAATGIGTSVLHRERKRRGIPPRPKAEAPWGEIVAAYEAGESEYSLSQRFDVARTSIRPRLEAAGVPIRDMSTAGRSRAAKMTAEERLHQAAAAHAAVRGTSQSEELLCRRALAKQRKGRYDSPGEMLLGEGLSDRGLIVVPQKAIGKYNVDLAVAPIAVEVLGGGWHSTKRSHATRTPEILNSGWHLVFVWNHEGASALAVDTAADYVTAFLQEVRRNPTAIGQYRVISGSGQLLASGCAEDDEFPLVPPPRGSLGKGA